MEIHDPVLPAVAHLMGPSANDILHAAVAAANGILRHARVSQVQYRPGHDLVVQYRCDIDWPDGRRRRDTLLAATTQDGPLLGTVPLVAETDAGSLEVSVSRYPFDPLVEGLPIAVTADRLSPLFLSHMTEPVTVEVVAYRPTERAVVRVVDQAGRTVYVKAVRPGAAQALIERHVELRSEGLPVPEVLDAEVSSGLVLLGELPGPTLRERIKAGMPSWPTPDLLLELTQRIARTPALGLPKVPGRIRDAIGHARMLQTVTSDMDSQLQELTGIFEAALPAAEARCGQVIHGDLHEGQLIVDDNGTIVGLLDIDDLGVGDPLDDLATLVAHSRFRALVAGSKGGRIRDYSEELRAGFARHVDRTELDISISAVLVGLATGPFRIQQAGWPVTVSFVIDDARSLAERAMHG